MTTTTTTRESIYDLSRVMRRAWEMRRAAAVRLSCRVSEVHMGECMRAAWAEEYGLQAPVLAARIVREWAEMSETAQVRFLAACVRKAAKNEIGYSVEDQYNQRNEHPAFYAYGHDFDEYVSAAYIRLTASLDVERLAARIENRAAAGKRPLDLVYLVYNAARAGLVQILRDDAKHAAAGVRVVHDDDGQEHSFIETMVASPMFGSAGCNLLTADIRAFLAGRDATDCRILALKIEGYTERETAEFVGVSNVAVHKRLKKLQADLAAYLGRSIA